jgi:hypothetical protein
MTLSYTVNVRIESWSPSRPPDDEESRPMRSIPAYTRVFFDLADRHGGPPRHASVVVSLAEQWLRWPEATDPAWVAQEIPPLVVALNVEGMVPAESRS